MMSSAMRQLEERHMASKVELMVWSNKMDLLALSNVKGEVTLHRLSWQRVWTLSPPLEDVTVNGIAWRPDGQVIAIGYSNGILLLVDVENKDIVHKSNYSSTVDEGCSISSISWLEEKGSLTGTSHNNLIQENAANFLPRLPPISRTFGSINEDSNEILEDTKKVSCQKELNFLIVGFTNGQLFISVFGLFECGIINLPDDIKSNAVPIAVEITADLKNIFILISNGNYLKLIIYDCYVLNSYCKEIYALAYKHGQIMSLMDYLENTMHAICEAYENMLLLDMESKLSHYADTMPEGTVSADFLELLMFGHMTDSLESFLLHDLTDKGIKKLGHSIELSHSNIQKLVLKHVQAVGQSIAYHLSELKGLARYTERFQVLGVDEPMVTKSFTEVGSFLVKANEVLLVIDVSMKKYKALFKWLYDVILRISDDRVPDVQIPGINEQDTKFIADYLYNLEGYNAKSKKKHCFLDHLGQYINDEELTYVLSSEKNPWEAFLKDNPCIASNPAMIPRQEKLSLIQQHNRLKQVLKDAFSSPQKAIGSKISVASVIHLMGVSSLPKVSITHIFERDKLILAFLPHLNTTSFVYMDVIIQEGNIFRSNIYFKSRDVDTGYTVVDLQIYNKDTISVLLQQPGETRHSVFVQMPMRKIQELVTPTDRGDTFVDGITMVEAGALRIIENMVACRLAVSGSRRVAVLLSENMHKVRTYEMEVEEDEEEEDMEISKDSEGNPLNQSVVAINDPEWPNALLVGEQQLEEIINHLNSSSNMTNAVESYEYIKNNSLAELDLEDEENKHNFQVMPYKDLLITEVDCCKAYSCCFKCFLGFIDYSDQPDQDYKHVVVYQDDLTKFTILKPLKEKNGRDVLRCLMDIFSMIGVPAKIYTPEKSLVKSLMSKDIGSFCQDFSTKIKLPKSSHFEEIECPRIDKAIKKWMERKKSAEWSIGLYLVQFQNNVHYNNDILAAPFSVLLRPNYTYSRKKYTRYLIQTRDEETTTDHLSENLINSLESSKEQCLTTEMSENEQGLVNTDIEDNDEQEDGYNLLEEISEKGSEHEMQEIELSENQSELQIECKPLIENEPEQKELEEELLKNEPGLENGSKELLNESELEREKKKLLKSKSGVEKSQNELLESDSVIERSNRELLESEYGTSRKEKKLLGSKSDVEKDKKMLESKSDVAKDKNMLESESGVEKDKKMLESKSDVEKDKKMLESKSDVAKDKNMLESESDVEKDKKMLESKSDVEKDKKMFESKSDVEKDKKMLESKSDVEKDKKMLDSKSDVEKDKKMLESKSDVEKDNKILESKSDVEKSKNKLLKSGSAIERSNRDLLESESGTSRKYKKMLESKSDVEKDNKILESKTDVEKSKNKLLKSGSAIERSNRDLLESESGTSRKYKKRLESKLDVEKSKNKLVESGSAIDRSNRNLLESDSETETKNKELLESSSEIEKENTELHKSESEAKQKSQIKNVEESKENIKLAEDIIRLKKVDVQKTFPLKLEIIKIQDKKRKMYLKVVPRDNNDRTDWYECAFRRVSSRSKAVENSTCPKKSHKSTCVQNKQKVCLVCKKKKRLKPSLKPNEKLEVGSTVRVRVPVMERQKGYPNFILAVIVQETLNGMYRVATPCGILKESFKKDQLTPCNHQILTPEDIINLQEIEICKALAFPWDGDLIRCTCQRDLGFCNPRFTYHSKCYR